MLPAKDAYTLPLFYHLNSEPWLNYEAYTDPSCEPQYKTMGGGETLALPRSSRESVFRKLLQDRQSCREYSRRAMPLTDLSALLEGAYGIIGLAEFDGGIKRFTRAVPSAGGLYPLELYSATRRVEELQDGLYHYNILYHTLEPLAASRSTEEMDASLMHQHYLQDANVLLFLSAVFTRTLKKYGPRGYRYCLLEAGHVTQNICLLAAEMGLATICIGGFRDGKLNRLLELDGKSEAVIYCIGVGYAAA